jgi:hypothetical protein
MKQAEQFLIILCYCFIRMQMFSQFFPTEILAGSARISLDEAQTYR